MDRTQTQKLARALHILVTVTLAVNILALVVLPGLLYYNPNSLLAGAQDFMEGVVHAGEDDIVAAAWFGLVFSWPLVLADAPQLLPPCLFLLVCGLCTAVILQQGRRILTTVEAGEPFQRANAQALRRAAALAKEA